MVERLTQVFAQALDEIAWRSGKFGGNELYGRMRARVECQVAWAHGATAGGIALKGKEGD